MYRDYMDHQAVLEEAWGQAGTTTSELPAVDVNQVLADTYDGVDFEFTRDMLWDMEVKKAAAPDVYIPTVVRAGSAEKFPSVRRGAVEDFTRVSEQRLWARPDRYETIIEHVRLDHAGQRAFFVGAAHYTAPDGREFVAGTGQPLFHVEHSVGGSARQPLNLWRIVHLTEQPDPALTAVFDEMARDRHLRVFVEVYIERDLGRKVSRRTG
jgi:hypothetical protein